MIQAVLGAALAAVVALLAYRARALTLGGAAAAFAVGTIVFGSGGWPAAAVLFAFFIPSALISRIGAKQASPRNGWQVLANGGVAAVCALAATHGGLFAAAFAGAFSAASADTWGTEIGTLSRTPPVSILTLQHVETGRSGGVTVLGSAAAGGIAGALLDSVLGASLQALRWCPACERECETRVHQCGSSTVLRRGVGWLENDGVNFAATLGGAIVASLAAS